MKVREKKENAGKHDHSILVKELMLERNKDCCVNRLDVQISSVSLSFISPGGIIGAYSIF
jgi:hypothetical protein